MSVGGGGKRGEVRTCNFHVLNQDLKTHLLVLVNPCGTQCHFYIIILYAPLFLTKRFFFFHFLLLGVFIVGKFLGVLKQDEREKAASAEAARSSTFSSPSGGGGGIGPLPIRHGGGKGDDDGDSLISKRMPYCMAMMVLLAIVYVLARWEVSPSKSLPSPPPRLPALFALYLHEETGFGHTAGRSMVLRKRRN